MTSVDVPVRRGSGYAHRRTHLPTWVYCDPRSVVSTDQFIIRIKVSELGIVVARDDFDAMTNARWRHERSLSRLRQILTRLSRPMNAWQRYRVATSIRIIDRRRPWWREATLTEINGAMERSYGRPHAWIEPDHQRGVYLRHTRPSPTPTESWGGEKGCSLCDGMHWE